MSSLDQSGVCFESLVAFLMDYHRRIDQEQASSLVRAHKCKFCRTSFATLFGKAQTPVFVEDSRKGVHVLCPGCSEELLGNDTGAREVDISAMQDSMRKTVFGILVGELRHTRFTEETRTKVVSSVQQRGEPASENQERKPEFVRKHPARRGMAVGVH